MIYNYRVFQYNVQHLDLKLWKDIFNLLQIQQKIEG